MNIRGFGYSGKIHNYFFDSFVLFFCFFKTKEKYEKSLKDLDNATPQYMENMEQVFEQCQQFEEKRLHFFREVLLEVEKHLDLSTVAR